ncbi:MAG: 23S rRNA (adenine(2503)-C(2))-methyltransferase RlmN [Clostridiales bacterium]|jgi:23S rRNA (adenine2503-C2)-methyltransferase|nr:23S rRNA (adenine(2503)-C(2))-methyltransferase RlmN [Clostridiales bacterium]
MSKLDNKINILSLEPYELADVVSSYGDKPFRAKQIFGWLGNKGVESFGEMTNIPLKLREHISSDYYIGLPKVVKDQKSKSDGTRKCLYEFADGSKAESVFMKYNYGNSICVSTQVGCKMGCKFCASTMNGFERNLEAGEILSQIIKMRNLTGEQISHVVLMGIGEPFDNYDNVAKFLRLINNNEGYGLGMRNITISTCGLVPMIEKFAEDFPQVNLAVSLHAPNDEIRQQTMPVANLYNFDTLMKACKNYTIKTGRRITFEYAMINGVNDSVDCANELSSKLKGWLTHVNLIPLNEVEERNYERTDIDNILRYKQILESHNIAVTIRRTLGSDIDAACGQLRNSY